MKLGSPSQRETAQNCFLYSTQTVLAKITRNLQCCSKSNIFSLSSSRFSAAFNTVGYSRQKHSLPSASTASPCVDLSSAYLATSSQSSWLAPSLCLHSKLWNILRAQSSTLSLFLSIVFCQLIMQSWALNTSCMQIIPKFLSHHQTSTLNSRRPYRIIYWTSSFKVPSRASNVTCQIRTLDFPSPHFGPLPSVPLPFFSISVNGTPSIQLLKSITQRLFLILLTSHIHCINESCWLTSKYVPNLLFNSTNSTSIETTIISCIHYCKGWCPNFHSHCVFILHKAEV